MTDIFGLILDADLIEERVKAFVAAWMDVYLSELETQRGLAVGTLPRPRTYVVAEEVDKELGQQTPAIVVVSPGIVGRPVKEGDGTYRARWQVAIGAVVDAGGSDPRGATKRLLRRYCAAIRALMVQNKNYSDTSVIALPAIDPGHEIVGVDWVDESYDLLSFEDGQTFAAGEVVFEIEVTQVVNPRLGPSRPTAPNPGTQVGQQWPTVQSTRVIVTDPVPVTEEV